MKNFLKFLFVSFMLMFLATAMGHAISAIVPVISEPYALWLGVASTGALVAYTYLHPPDRRMFRAGVEVEFFVNYITGRLWKDVPFLGYVHSDDEYVVGGKIVHLPQPGSLPTVTKNRSVFPASAVRRTDTDILYSLDEYSTQPTHIQEAEKLELSYSKIDSVLGDHMGQLNEIVADDMIIKWASDLPSAAILETTGPSASAKIPGQTGNRKVMVHADLRRARTLMNLQNVPANDRYVLLEENMADELTQSLSTSEYKDFSRYVDGKTGSIGMLYGFHILTRATVGMAAADLAEGKLAVNALGAATGATDTAFSLAWQKDSLTKALGEVKFFEDVNNPLYYGDVYSAMLRMGGRRRRADNAGIVVIKQATP